MLKLSVMKNLYLVYTILLLIFPTILFAQATGTISGTVKDKNTQEALIGATVLLEGTGLGAVVDIEGQFNIKNIPPKSYNLKVQMIGYEPFILYNIVINSGNIQTYNIEMLPVETVTEEVVITKRNFGKKSETPLSVQNLSAEEIKNNPGGNFDISKVVQVLPGVGSTAGSVGSFRNDIIIRGGAPNENVFYLDGIEVPVINHFATQGSAGGPAGILNVSFIEDVNVSSSAFGARYDNTLSSVFQFRQKDGNREKLQGNIRLSATEVAATFDGPLTKNTTFLASARRSYLQFLFQAIDLPIRPNYWDFQYKTTTKLNDKTTLTTLGLGAIDEFDIAVPKNSSPEKEYILRSVPFNEQWNYTIGGAVKRLVKDGFLNVALSRNMMFNSLDRFENGDNGNEAKRLLKLRSHEVENKFRADVNKYTKGWKYSYGVSAQYVKYDNDFYSKIRRELRDTTGNLLQPSVELNFNTAIDFFRMGAFAEVNRRVFNERLGVTFGIRSDMNTFTNSGLNPLRTLSPRASLSYALNEKWNLNATSGMYYKLPVYTVLGFKDERGNFINKDNEYIRVNHYVAGVEYLPTNSARITLEGFYKMYSNYPISARDGISLANQGGDFGSIGNERTLSIGKGRTYGAELFLQQKLTKRTFATISYTFVRSEFSGKDPDKYIPSAWDTKHLLSALVGYKFGKGWEAGMKYRFASGAPYTPFNEGASRANYISLGTGVLDYERYNSGRLRFFNQLDVRVSKRYNFKKWSLDLYLDIQNATLTSNPANPQYTFQRLDDNSDWFTTDGKPVQLDGSNAVPVILSNESQLVTPTFGFVVEF